MTTQQTNLSELSNDERFSIYNALISGCMHLFSKGKLQLDIFNSLKVPFATLAKQDPIFLAHLAAYTALGESKDLTLMSVYFNFLSDADGQPFFPGSTLTKPNLRQVSAALTQNLAPNQLVRLFEVARMKYEVPGLLPFGSHAPQILWGAGRNSIIYRENELQLIRGIKRAGLTNKYIQCYRYAHMTPTREAAGILGWKQRGRDIVKESFSFDGLSAKKIAEYISANKLSPTVAIPMLGANQMNAEIAKALLQNSSGNQAVILQNMFRDRGFLEIPEINALFITKVKTATTAVDRMDTLSKNQNDDAKKAMAEVRSEVRKKTVGNIGKVFIHLDLSSSMHAAVDFAKNSGSIFAECVANPETNFGWAGFTSTTVKFPKPQSFTKEGFHAALYGVVARGSTNIFAAYPEARRFGADVDVYITDQGHTDGDINASCRRVVEAHGRPTAVVIINFGTARETRLQDAFQKLGIPVTIIDPKALTSSALVASSIATAVKGQTAIIDQILETPLPRLPKWYNSKTMREAYTSRI